MPNKWLLIFIFSPLFASSQTPEKWASLVNWDGYSHWSKYITFSPRYLGPNSLQVPLMGNGSIDTLNTLELGGAFHFSKGDYTQNLKLKANYCFLKDRLSFQLLWVPVERFHTSEDLKIKRKVYYNNYYDRHAVGDIIFNTSIQLLNRWRKNIHLALRIGYRFPTSNGVGAARYTDAPGYCFDISAAKVLPSNPRWKLTAMTGFYVWQMNGYGQNDAFLAGLGIEHHSSTWRWQFYTTGYFGWRNNGDDPVLIGGMLERKFGQLSFNIGMRHGLHDFNYTSAEFGVQYNFQSTVK